MNALRLITISLLMLVSILSCQKEQQEEVFETGTVKDQEGTTYKTVKIGGKWWMTENLRSKHFADGSELNYVPIFANDSVWANSSAPSYTFLNDSVYGCLYNQAAVQSVKHLAPQGWHVATDQDWKDLELAIGMSEEETIKLAWRGTNEAEMLLPLYSEGWPTNSVPFGNNKYLMNVLPAGCKLFNGISSVNGNMAFFWTSSLNASQAWYRYFDAKKKTIFRQVAHVQYGMSVRCVKD
jgi:uncharacterized protein (TIGR02145 family)